MVLKKALNITLVAVLVLTLLAAPLAAGGVEITLAVGGQRVSFQIVPDLTELAPALNCVASEGSSGGGDGGT